MNHYGAWIGPALSASESEVESEASDYEVIDQRGAPLSDDEEPPSPRTAGRRARRRSSGASPSPSPSAAHAVAPTIQLEPVTLSPAATSGWARVSDVMYEMAAMHLHELADSDGFVPVRVS